MDKEECFPEHVMEASLANPEIMKEGPLLQGVTFDFDRSELFLLRALPYCSCETNPGSALSGPTTPLLTLLHVQYTTLP
jgi:hypothetical protein